MRFGTLGLAAILGLVMGAPLVAQDDPMADVGIGAPRTTLAYMVTRPRTMMAIAGHNGVKYSWMPERPKAPAEGEPEEMQGGDMKLMWMASDTFLPLFETSSRLDVVLVDVSTGGPRMYLDLTLAANAKVELVPEWLAELDKEAEELTITDATFHGIATKRYSFGEGMPDIYAFVREGHLYVCAFDSVAEGLCNGFTNGSRDGESLAESTTFKSWYRNRKGTAIDVWLNAREFRRWVDRGEGALPPAGRQLYEDLDALLQLRTWTQFTLGLDYDVTQGRMQLDVDIVSRKEIPLFEKTQFTSKSFATIGKYAPEGSLAITGFQMGDLNGLIERMTEDFDRIGASVMKLEQEMRPRGRPDQFPMPEGEGFPEDKGEVPPMPPMPEKGDGGMRSMQEPGMGGGEDDGEPKAGTASKPFSDMMAELKEQLAELGTTPQELFAVFDGSFLVGVRGQEKSPWGDLELFSENQAFFVLGLKDSAKFIAIMNKAMAALGESNPDGGSPIQAIKVGELPGFLFEGRGPALVVTKDALLVSLTGNFEDPNGSMAAMIASSTKPSPTDAAVVGRLARSTATMVLGFDIYRAMIEKEEDQLAATKKLSTDARPNFDPSIKPYVKPGFAVSAALNMDAKSLNFKVVLTGIHMDKMIELAMTSSGGMPPAQNGYFYADSQLNQLFGKFHENFINKGEALPKALDEAVKAGKLRRMYLQSPNDPRFEGAAQLNWFPGDMVDNEEFQAPQNAIIKANEAKDFISYTLVPGADLTKIDGSYILVYETEANTAGGRMVLYTNGMTGWLHADVWEKAMELVKAGKPIPAPEGFNPWGKGFPDMPPMPNGDDMPGGEMPPAPDGDKPTDDGK